MQLKGILVSHVSRNFVVGSEALWLSAYLGGAHVFWSPRTSSKEIAVTESQKVKITRRAYELWQQAGEPKGRDEEFYLQAERELNDAPVNAVTETMPPTPSQGRL